MAPDSQPGRARSIRDWAWLIPGAVLTAMLLAHVFAAPGVEPTCARILELAAAAGERVGPAERDACERRYREIRAEVGALRWARMSWCTRRANTLPDAGGC